MWLHIVATVRVAWDEEDGGLDRARTIDLVMAFLGVFLWIDVLGEVCEEARECEEVALGDNVNARVSQVGYVQHGHKPGVAHAWSERNIHANARVHTHTHTRAHTHTH